MIATCVDLKELRESAGLSAEYVAAALGKSVSTVRFWEAGKYTPNLNPSETKILVELYRCTLDVLSQSFEETQQKKSGKEKS